MHLGTLTNIFKRAYIHILKCDTVLSAGYSKLLNRFLFSCNMKLKLSYIVARVSPEHL